MVTGMFTMIEIGKIFTRMANRIAKKKAAMFAGEIHQEDEVIVYGGSCRYCGAPEKVIHCHLLFEEEVEKI